MNAASAPGRRPWRSAVWVLAGVLTACATPGPGAEAPVFSGRLAVQIAAQPPEAPARALSAHFALAGDASAGWLDLSTPLGTSLGSARWSPGAAVLRAPGAPEQRYDGMDGLTRALFGEALPVAALFDWLAGRPWPAAPSTALPTPGFTQLGWDVDLMRFEAGTVAARRSAPPALVLRVQLDGARHGE